MWTADVSGVPRVPWTYEWQNEVLTLYLCMWQSNILTLYLGMTVHSVFTPYLCMTVMSSHCYYVWQSGVLTPFLYPMHDAVMSSHRSYVWQWYPHPVFMYNKSPHHLPMWCRAIPCPFTQTGIPFHDLIRYIVFIYHINRGSLLFLFCNILLMNRCQGCPRID